MRTRLAGRLAALILAPSGLAHGAEPRACNVSAADEPGVAQTVHAFYEAERTGDVAAWRAMTTPDFRMFHEGVVTPPETFAKWIAHERAALDRDKSSTWTLDVGDLKVSLDCTTALTTQTLHNVTEVPQLKPGYRYDERFLESFWMRKEADGRSRVAFWDATMVPKATHRWAEAR